jgi:hypothetical protein
MTKTFEETFDQLKQCIEDDGGIFDLPWCQEFLYPFYEHFSDENLAKKAGALIGFWGLLCEWEDRSVFPFFTGIEDYECHHFDKYVEAFLEVKLDVKKELPNIYFVIIESLKLLDKRDGFENEFPNLSNELFSIFRNELFKDHLEKPEDVYKNALKEEKIFIN